ncbi:MAG: hypothetical protein CFE45_03540 [Burkholderiales bacterium PBB5]|nr:MAG: hypothetical protein CFE45_03540 [Burkholderiales bacterium PBB5]
MSAARPPGVASPAVNYETAWLAAEQDQRGHIAALLQQLQQHHGLQGAQVLELGSGLGHNLRQLAPHNRVRGVDGLAEAAARASAQGIPTLCANLDQPLPLPDACADWVLCLDVLEHLVAPEQALREAVRLLRPGGRVVINLPNHFDWRGRWRILRGSGIDSQRYFPDRPGWHYPHLRFFRRRDLDTLLAAAGLAVQLELSHQCASLPKARLLATLGLARPVQALARAWPDLLQSGFFVVAGRRSTG